jgi:hypothetical protein
VAYAVRRGKKQLVVVDGDEGKEYDAVRNDSLTFSPDSRRVAYSAAHGDKKWLVVVDEEESKEYEGLLAGGSLLFDSPTTLHTLVVRGAEFLRVEIELVQR